MHMLDLFTVAVHVFKTAGIPSHSGFTWHLGHLRERFWWVAFDCPYPTGPSIAESAEGLSQTAAREYSPRWAHEHSINARAHVNTINWAFVARLRDCSRVAAVLMADCLETGTVQRPGADRRCGPEPAVDRDRCAGATCPPQHLSQQQHVATPTDCRRRPRVTLWM